MAAAFVLSVLKVSLIEFEPFLWESFEYWFKV